MTTIIWNFSVYAGIASNTMRYPLIVLSAVLPVSVILLLLKTVSVTPHKLFVTTSFYPLYFFASEIGGDKADVKNITPPGSEPHDYEPSIRDMARIENSTMLILNGGIEAWGDRIKENLTGTRVKIIVAGDDLLRQKINEEGRTVIDPHIWLAPGLAKKETEIITQAYISADPVNADYYRTNRKVLEDKIDQLNKEYIQGLTGCKQKDIVTSHAAFGYLVTAYGLNQVTISGLSPDAEPSPKELADLTEFVKMHGIKYIFFESLVNPKLANTLAAETGTKTLILNPLEGLTDQEIKQGKNYFTVMKENLKNLETALECTK